MVRGRRNPLHTKLPARLKQARKQCGLSRVALCQAAGLSDMVVAYVETEERTPTMGTVVKLAMAMGVSAGWLAYGVTETTAAASESTCRGAAEEIRQELEDKIATLEDRIASVEEERNSAIAAVELSMNLVFKGNPPLPKQVQ